MVNGVGGGLNVSSMFDKAFETVRQRGQELNAMMDNLKGNNTEDMLKMQFAVGQYNAMLEAASSVTKSLIDEVKNLAQRTG